MNKALGTNNPEDDVANLVKRSQAGDKGAFGSLVRLHQVRAMKTGLRILADAHEASEAVQDGFVTAYLKIKKLKDPERFTPWLLRTILNASNDRLRRIVRRKRRFTAPNDLEHESVVDHTADARELELAIQSAMSRLSAIQAKAIALFGIEDLSHKEVADILGCSQQAARWHVHQARKKLKVLLKDYLE